jgi:hypothetical protein
MKNNDSKKQGSALKLGPGYLEARAAEAEKQAEVARKLARLAKAKFKDARKAYKQAKKFAKQARKQAKAASKELKQRAKARPRKVARKQVGAAKGIKDQAQKAAAATPSQRIFKQPKVLVPSPSITDQHPSTAAAGTPDITHA